MKSKNISRKNKKILRKNKKISKKNKKNIKKKYRGGSQINKDNLNDYDFNKYFNKYIIKYLIEQRKILEKIKTLEKKINEAQKKQKEQKRDFSVLRYLQYSDDEELNEILKDLSIDKKKIGIPQDYYQGGMKKIGYNTILTIDEKEYEYITYLDISNGNKIVILKSRNRYKVEMLEEVFKPEQPVVSYTPSSTSGSFRRTGKE